MTGRKIDAEPEFGEPTTELPGPLEKPQSAYWVKVVEHAKKNPGVWTPLANSPLALTRLYNIAQQMRNHPGARRIPVPLREAGMQSRVVGGQFWFRYDAPVPTLVRRTG